MYRVSGPVCGVILGHWGEGRVAETRLCCLQALALPRGLAGSPTLVSCTSNPRALPWA